MPRSGWLAIGAVGGSLAGAAGGPVVVVVVGLALLCVVATPARRRAIPGLLVVAAAALVLVRGVPLVGAGQPITPTIGEGPWIARVESTASPRDGRRSIVLLIDGRSPPIRVASRVPLIPEVSTGMTIRIDGTLEPVPEGDYGAYLHRIGVVATLEADSLSVIERLGHGPSAWLGLARSMAGDALAAGLPEPAAGLAAGIVVGLRERVDRDLATDFTTAGVSHVVAISGWNIAIVAGGVMALAARARRRRRAVLAIATIAAYTLFAGASASVVRAAVMACVALVAREKGRPAAGAAALGWAVVGLVLIDPAIASDPGFQLSVLGTAGLIGWADPLEARLRRLTRGRLPDRLAESLAISLAAQAATLPVVVATFGRIATVAPLVNLFVVPLIPPAMAASVVALGGGLAEMAGAPGGVGVALAAPAWALLSLVIGFVRLGASLPGASLSIGPPLDVLLGVAIATCLVIVWQRPSALRRVRASRRGMPQPSRRLPRSAGPHRRIVTLSVVALIVAATSAATAVVAAPDGALRITVLDVGQGDAILLEGPAGGRMLIDGGPDPARLRVRLDERLPPWDRRIETVILSHPHEDHVAGLLALLARYRVDRIYEPGMVGPGPGYETWRSGLVRASVSTNRLAAGDRLSLDGINLRVLWPDARAVPRRPTDGGTAINNVSIVLLGSIGRQRFLLTGDIEEGIDPILLSRRVPRVDVLKVAHHGSRTSSTAAFLAAARPAVAIVSAGRGNPYGHPTASTLDRLEAVGATVMRTDEDGSASVRLDGRTLGRGSTGGSATRPPGRPVGPSAPLATRTIGCPIPRPPAVPEARPDDPTEGDQTLFYHRADEMWHLGRPAIHGPHPHERPGPSTCEQRRPTFTLARRRRNGLPKP
jgi:competence protein ComEC